MKPQWIRLSRRYAAALGKHVEHNSEAGLQQARRIGCQAVAGGLGVLDFARMHDLAVATLIGVERDGRKERTEAFFAEAFAQVELTSRNAREAAGQLRQLQKVLRQRTLQLAASQRLLRQGAGRRAAIAHDMKAKTEHYAKLLEESRDMQHSVQSLTRQVLSAQEDDRATVSRKLHNNIAQELLGIQVRLAALKTEAARNNTGVQRKIASTERLVNKSTRTLRRFAGRLA